MLLALLQVSIITWYTALNSCRRDPEQGRPLLTLYVFLSV